MKIIGHRGARGLAPENTIVSLQKALQYHVDEIEFDLRVTSDGVVVLHHDLEIIDASGQKLLISDCSFKELSDHKPDLAKFEVALKAVGDKAPLYIEVKPGEPTQPIIRILKSQPPKKCRLASFSLNTLLELNNALPEIDKIVLEKWSGVRASHRARKLGTKYIGMNQRWLWGGFISRVAKSGYSLYAYTVNDPKKAQRWAKCGLYGVVTDYPDLFDN